MATFVVFAASYDTLGAAEADYHAVRELYLGSGLIDTYDAAVPSPARDPDESYRRSVSQAEAAVREAEAAAAAAEREAKRYSTFQAPGDSGAGGLPA